MRRIFTLLTALVMVFGSTVPAHALLIDRGGGLIYDTDRDITWLQNANYAGGTMNWGQAMNWADTLSYYDSVRDYTYTDWRLPTALNQDGSGPDSGYNATGSEMGHLYYTELGNLAYPGYLTNTGPFNNIQQTYYWSSTEYAPEPVHAWAFSFYIGHQEIFGMETPGLYAWAVRPGDVVPEPATVSLLALGLLVLRRRKSA